MGRFLLFVIVVGAVALYFTNPTTEDVQAKLNGQVPAELTAAMPSAPGAPSVPAAPDMPAPPAPPADMPAPPAGVPAPPADAPGAAPAAPEMPAVPGGAMQLDRKDYYLFSIYKVTVGGQQLPGCIIGVAKQAVPSTHCPG
jgi:hypothetical protein